jgi:hypothetical protein
MIVRAASLFLVLAAAPTGQRVRSLPLSKTRFGTTQS